jgi:hypothetical protein
MEEAIDKVLTIFYGIQAQDEIRNLRVLHWSPDDGIISVRWQQGESTITVKSMVDSNGERIVNELK